MWENLGREGRTRPSDYNAMPGTFQVELRRNRGEGGGGVGRRERTALEGGLGLEKGGAIGREKGL